MIRRMALAEGPWYWREVAGFGMSPRRLCRGWAFCLPQHSAGHTRRDGCARRWESRTSAYSTPAPGVTENSAEPWRENLTCSSLSPPGKSLELFSNQGNSANMADGQEQHLCLAWGRKWGRLPSSWAGMGKQRPTGRRQWKLPRCMSGRTHRVPEARVRRSDK